MTSEREKEIREHWDKKKNEEGFSFFGYEDLIEEIERLKSESIERNKWIRVQAVIVSDLKLEIEAIKNNPYKFNGEGDIRDCTAYIQLQDALEKCHIERDKAIEFAEHLREEIKSLKYERDYFEAFEICRECYVSFELQM